MSDIETETVDGAHGPVQVASTHRAAAHQAPPRRRRGWARPILGGLAVVAAVAGGLWYRQARQAHAAGHEVGRTPHATKSQAGMPVETVQPRAGGITRVTTQAGSVHAFQHADLFAKISGYLKVQDVDIGDTVKQDQLLAVIEDPEIDEAVLQAAASLNQTRAKVGVAEANIRSAQANKAATDARIRQAQADVAAKASNEELQSKQLERIRGLVARNAVEAKLLDEQQDRHDVSASDSEMARAAVITAQAEALASAALVEQSQADLLKAQADVQIAEADLSKAKVMQQYTRIRSPYDGVVTLRSFHRGSFIRAATGDVGLPLLSVARTDLMRIVLPIPDRDVPFLDRGDAASIRIDALPGREFVGTVSRFAESEDPQSRNMRTEVDVPNPDRVLREGMYGRITVVLQAAAPGSLTIPSSSLLGQDGKGDGSVYVVRGGKAHKVGVRIGADNGVEVEILSGLSRDDRVVSRYNGTIAEGTALAPGPAQLAQAAH